MDEVRTPTVWTTGIGSVPFTDITKASLHVLSSYTLPFVPELTHEHERSDYAPMVRDMIEGDEFLRTGRPFATSLAEGRTRLKPNVEPFLRLFAKVRALPESPLAIHFIGPYTLAKALGSNDFIAASTWCHRAIANTLAYVETQVPAALMIILDEPLLDSKSLQVHSKQIAAILEDISHSYGGALSGVHCCADIDFGQLSQSFPGSILSIDVSRTSNIQSLSDHLKTGGNWIYGIVNTMLNTIDTDLILENALTIARQHVRISDAPIILSAACGTGRKTESFETALVATLAAASALIASSDFS